MTLEHLRKTLARLQDAEVRFLIVGGLAVLAHGHSRVTHDLDLVLSLDPSNAAKAIETLTELGFRPRIPVDAKEFCDPGRRDAWIREKHLQVFSLVSSEMEGMVVDIFAESPFDFERELGRAFRTELPGLPANLPFVSLDTLIAMKEKAARAIDLDDLRHLQNPT